MVVGGEPRPQFHPFARSSEKFQQRVADGRAATPRRVARRGQLRQYMQSDPVAGPLRIKLGGYRVVLATLLVYHPDRDEFDGDAVFDELAVVEEPHDRPAYAGRPGGQVRTP